FTPLNISKKHKGECHGSYRVVFAQAKSLRPVRQADRDAGMDRAGYRAHRLSLALLVLRLPLRGGRDFRRAGCGAGSARGLIPIEGVATGSRNPDFCRFAKAKLRRSSGTRAEQESCSLINSDRERLSC